MSQHDPNAAGLAANEFEATEAERLALAEAGQGGAPAVAPGADGAAPPAAAAGAPAAEAASAAAASAAAAGGADGGAPTTPPGAGGEAAAVAAGTPEAAPPAAPAAMPAPNAFVPTYIPEDRDYATEIGAVNQELMALKAKYKAGDVEDEQYEEAYEALRDKRSGLERALDRAELQATLNRQNADQAWAYLQRQFLSDPTNAAIAASPLLFAAWEQGMQVVVDAAAAEGRTLTDWDLMVGARQQLEDAGMLQAQPAAGTPTPAAPPPRPNRAPPLADVPQTLTAVPAAADPSSRTTVDSAAEQGIEDLEAYLASKPEAERDRILRELPGQFLND